MKLIKLIGCEPIHHTARIIIITITSHLLCMLAYYSLTIPPQSHLGRARRYPYVRECTLPLYVLAVACTMRNEALRSVMGRYGSVTGRYRTLRNRYGKYRFCPLLIEF